MSSTTLFVALVLVVALLVVLGLKRAGVASVAVAFVVLACLAVPGVLARLGMLALASHLLVFRKLAQHRS